MEEGLDRQMIARDAAETQALVQHLFGKAKFQFDVEDFLRSSVGRYLAARAEKERVSALEELAMISPTHASAIAEIQQRIRVCDSWQQWLADAVTEGIAAQQQLIDMGQ